LLPWHAASRPRRATAAGARSRRCRRRCPSTQTPAGPAPVDCVARACSRRCTPRRHTPSREVAPVFCEHNCYYGAGCAADV
jgi:hypothetical protein